MMNHLLSTIDISDGQESIEDVLSQIKSTVIQIAIDTDLFFVKEETIKTKALMDQLNVKNKYYELHSDYGHDAFLIEYEQMSKILEPIFK